MEPRAERCWTAITLVFYLSVAAAMIISEGVSALRPIAADFHPAAPVTSN